MKTKKFLPLIALIAGIFACAAEIGMMVYQASNQDSSLTLKAELLLLAYALTNAVFAVYFIFDFLSEKVWTKVKGFSMIGGIFSAVSFVFYTVFVLGFFMNNQTLKGYGVHMSEFTSVFYLFLILYLLVVYVDRIKSLIVQVPIIASVVSYILIKNILPNNYDYQNYLQTLTKATVTFTVRMVQTNLLIAIFIALSFLLMFIETILPKKIEEPVEELDSGDTIVDQADLVDEEVIDDIATDEVIEDTDKDDSTDSDK